MSKDYGGRCPPAFTRRPRCDVKEMPAGRMALQERAGSRLGDYCATGLAGRVGAGQESAPDMGFFRWRRWLVRIALVGAVALPAVASAGEGEPDGWRDLFRDGAFRQAYELVAEQDTVTGYALAIRSLIAEGLIEKSGLEQTELYRRAVALSEEAMARWPESARLLVLAARALGRYGDSIGNVQAFEEKVGVRARDYLRAALEIDPANIEAQAGLGAWHARLAGEGGFLAELLFGASESTGRNLMESAEPGLLENTALLYELARAWRSIGETEHAGRLAERAIAIDEPGVFAEYYRDRARRLLEKIEGG